MDALFWSWGLGPRAFVRTTPEIPNTNPGPQFISAAFPDRMLGAGVAFSMDGRGRHLDKIFFGRMWRSLTLKYEAGQRFAAGNGTPSLRKDAGLDATSRQPATASPRGHSTTTKIYLTVKICPQPVHGTGTADKAMDLSLMVPLRPRRAAPPGRRSLDGSRLAGRAHSTARQKTSRAQVPSWAVSRSPRQ